jgi:hypothetical protein
MQFFIHSILLPSLPRAMFELLEPEGSGSVIDLSVYSKDRLFRMYGSVKGAKRNPLLPPGAAPGDPLDLQLLRDSLVSIPTHLGNVIEYDLDDRPQYKNEHNDKYLQFVCNELRKVYPGRTIQGKSTRGVYVNVQIVPGNICGIARRQHKGNTTYFSVNVQTGRGRFQCTDPDCRATHSRGKFGIGSYPNFIMK